ncbi:MAG: hypothetical protein JW791_00280 [Nanoarchaeota archaeon]|nr:hypothetical protein [Nanoarchaeota archaeon]
MITSIVSSLVVISAVLLGEYLSSLVLGSLKDWRMMVLEIIIFLCVINAFLFSIVIVDNFFVQILVYFIVSFVSIITSKTLVFLVFRKMPLKVLFQRNLFNSHAVKLAKLLNKRLGKPEVLKLFKKAGFGTAFIEHLESVLTEL